MSIDKSGAFISYMTIYALRTKAREWCSCSAVSNAPWATSILLANAEHRWCCFLISAYLCCNKILLCSIERYRFNASSRSLVSWMILCFNAAFSAIKMSRSRVCDVSTLSTAGVVLLSWMYSIRTYITIITLLVCIRLATLEFTNQQDEKFIFYSCIVYIDSIPSVYQIKRPWRTDVQR